MKRTSKLSIAVILQATLVYLGANTCLGQVTYTSVKPVTVETDILNTGSLVEANTLGGIAVATTVNGVVFGNAQTALTSNWTPSGGDFSNNFSGPLNDLFSSLAFTPTTDDGVVTFTGLSTGHVYRLQLFFQNTINETGENQTVSIQAANRTITDISTPQILIAEFISTGTTQEINFIHGGFRAVFNAYALHELTSVPEPGTAGIFLGLGVLGYTGLSRRKHRPATSPAA